jgi:hypothetical protein
VPRFHDSPAFDLRNGFSLAMTPMSLQSHMLPIVYFSHCLLGAGIAQSV